MKNLKSEINELDHNLIKLQTELKNINQRQLRARDDSQNKSMKLEEEAVNLKQDIEVKI